MATRETEGYGLMAGTTIRRRVREGTLPDWGAAHYEGFRESMTSERDGTPFPCHFGAESERNGDALYTLCDSVTDPAALATLRDVLYRYTRVYRDHAERAPLVTFFRPSDRDLPYDEWFDAFWGVLQYLHDHDPEPWPYDIPADPGDPEWEFCFAGEPIFPTVRAPCYENRASRHTPHGLEITFQPRAIFAGITGDTAAGQAARDAIRDRLATYDEVPPHPDFGDWGYDLEWRQYMLPDDQSSHADCPMEVTKP